MILITILFCVSAFLLVYTYVGYPAMILALHGKSIKKITTQSPADQHWPLVSLIVAAYNEEDCIQSKIENSLSLDYPSDRIQLIFVSDGSTDLTAEIIERYPRVLHLHTTSRHGKLHAIKRATKIAKGSITIYSDANAALNRSSIKHLVSKFENKDVGAVSGEKRVMVSETQESLASGEGLYWRYESTLKKLDARFYSVVGAAGELFAIRTALFQEIAEDTILDDFMITMNINMQGYRTEYTSSAYALEAPSADLKSEYNRKVRIAAGGWQSMTRLSALHNPFQYGWLSFQYISRRVMRWAFAPTSLVVLLLTSMGLAMNGSQWVLGILLAQIAFYTLATWGWMRGTQAGSIPRVAFYFTFMHVCAMIGMVHYFFGTTTVLWSKAQRQKMPVGAISD